MQTVSSIPELRAALAALRHRGSLGFVPTMGALHAGHRSLVEASRAQCAATAVSIFVNPTQFAPNEDFTRYPRTLEADLAMLEAAGVDLVFTPTPEIMYPAGASTVIDVGELGNRLDGASRPGHFLGVATVVAKLFHLVQPEFAYFGQKDAAQVAVLRQMVRDLNMPVELVVCPIVREPDGLAMSSRNRYLSAEERRTALALSRALQAAEMMAAGGEVQAYALRAAMEDVLDREPGVRTDYVAVIDWTTLLPVPSVTGGALLAVAAWVGTTRLIDNLVLPAR